MQVGLSGKHAEQERLRWHRLHLHRAERASRTLGQPVRARTARSAPSPLASLQPGPSTPGHSRLRHATRLVLARAG
jgi:hypothetical protein